MKPAATARYGGTVYFHSNDSMRFSGQWKGPVLVRGTPPHLPVDARSPVGVGDRLRRHDDEWRVK